MTKPTRYYSNKQEKHVAKALCGKRSANSGAAPFTAGDVTLSDVLIECKTVTKPVNSYSIKKQILEKARKEAYAIGKSYAVLAFNFEPDGENYYVVSEKQFRELLETPIQK